MINTEIMINTELAREVAKIAKIAGEAILKIYNEADDIQIQQKDDNSPLTIADRTANAIICEHLEKLEVQFPIISEENKLVEKDVRQKYEYYWLVDPLDGTKEFIKRNGEFTVNIALIHQQRSILGVVYAPVMDEMYIAVKDEGAFLEKNGEEIELSAKYFALTDAELGVVCSRSHLNEPTENFIKKLNKPNLVATGSSLKFLILAKGAAHIYPRLAPTMEWDTGAAQIILEEAGGKVINNETGKPLLYNKDNLPNPHFIAYGGLVAG